MFVHGTENNWNTTRIAFHKILSTLKRIIMLKGRLASDVDLQRLFVYLLKKNKKAVSCGIYKKERLIRRNASTQINFQSTPTSDILGCG